MSYLMKIREKSPLVYNIMNEVGSNFIANGLIAVGASPSISNMPEEAEEMASKADAVVLNLGTLSKDRAKAMMLAGRAANEAGVPVLLDPIAIGATNFRTSVIDDILSNVELTAICANAGEIAVLGGALKKTTSPDSSLEENDPSIAEKVARKYETVVIATGQTDVVTDGNRTSLCKNGDAMLQNITTSGCLLTSIISAFVSIAGERIYEASIEAVTGYGIAAELAMKKADGPGSFIPALLDQLYFLNEETVATHQRLEQ
ncbi:hydroxyethylthiazole kinase [Lentibacillus jeotgali]|uniref:hydroxyethylthiazole kinase n=1 Tax=Lentibacillus jeotgali TaxID=558169 RepID=UPI0002627833|nr:hydroxyethylthiazole kinase [Lentibacillus jeotgali]